MRRSLRSMNMQVIRVRRSRPSTLAVAIALAITMLIVYLLTLQGASEPQAEAASAMRSESEIHLEGMDVCFLASSVHSDETQARVAAALCAQNGGAGLILRDGDSFAVVHEAIGDDVRSDVPTVLRSASGLTMQIDAPVQVISAISDGTGALYALARETANLASSMEKGEADAKTMCTLLSVYRTQLEHALAVLSERQNRETALICACIRRSLENITAVMARPDPGMLRMIHASACTQWIDLLSSLAVQI